MRPVPSPAALSAAIEAYFGQTTIAAEALGGGLINDSYVVNARGQAYVLQRLHPVFAPEIHHNIAAVTEHLAGKGIVTPLLVPTMKGELWTDLGRGGVWRLMTRAPGVSFDAVEDPAQVRAAGAALARFHGALADLDHGFVARRAGVHDTAAHLGHLEQALVEHRSHALYPEVEPLARSILAAAAAVPPLRPQPSRVVHGDPKISNILFAGRGAESKTRTTAIIDLDTVGPMPLCYELADAWRSWCNPNAEDHPEPSFEMDLFHESVRGYLSVPGGEGLVLDAREREGLVLGLEWITVELAARFAADALNETYFAHDAARYASAGAHNLARALSQFRLHQRVVETRKLRATVLRG